MRRLIFVFTAMITMTGCSVMRSVDDRISGTLENIPVMKMIGIESRQAQEQREHPSLPEDLNSGATVTLWLQASAWVNPSPMQSPSPVRVWVYELESIEKFGSANLAQLLVEPEKALGLDLRRVRDTVLAPDEEISVQWRMNQPGYIGIVADFRQPAASSEQSRQMIAFDGKTASSWQVRLTGNAVLAVANVTVKRPMTLLDGPPTLPARPAAKTATQKTK